MHSPFIIRTKLQELFPQFEWAVGYQDGSLHISLTDQETGSSSEVAVSDRKASYFLEEPEKLLRLLVGDLPEIPRVPAA
jgi:hypothetical protein